MAAPVLIKQPVDTLQDVKSARSQALSFVQAIDLQQLQQVLDDKRSEHAALQQELDISNAHLATLLQESRESLVRLQVRARNAKASYGSLYSDVSDFHDEIYSPLSRSSGQKAQPSSYTNGSRSSSSSATALSTHSSTLYEKLQAAHARIEALTRAKELFERLAKVEELSLIAKEQIKLPTPDSSIETYDELVGNVNLLINTKTASTTTQYFSFAPFVHEITKLSQKDLTKVLEQRLVKCLENLNWPGKPIQPNDLDYSTNEKVKAFKSAFLHLCRLQRTFSDKPLATIAYQPHNEVQQECSLAISALAQPLILRFRYHFDGKRQTNRLDKPEWYFAHILNALHDHEAFVRHDIQNLLNQGGLKGRDAMTDFIGALLRPLSRKIRATMPQLLELPAILGHTLYQALHFDQSVRETYGYTPRLQDGKATEWKGVSEIMLGDQSFFENWKEAERRFIDDKFFEIIGKPEAWHINEDYTPSTSNGLRPTNSALKVRDLFDQVTDRYKPLPEFKHRLPFFADIQIPLLDGYLQRISSATDAFETLSYGLMRAVPGTLTGADSGSARLTNGLNGLQRLVRAYVSASWMASTCEEWSEDIFFLDLWQDIKEASLKDASVRQRCKLVLDYAPSRNTSTSNEPTGVFDVFIHGFRQLGDRVAELIVKHIVREVSNELKPYLAKRWDEATFHTTSSQLTSGSSNAASVDGDSTNGWPTEISPELASPVTVFSALLSTLSASLPALPLNRLYRQVAHQLQETLLARSVYPKIWSERGGAQFRVDVEQGWLAAAANATKGKIRAPENGLRSLLDAALLVSLPSSTNANSSSTISDYGGGKSFAGAGTEIVPIAKVVQVAWDDTNDAALNEVLMKIGVRELVSRKDVKAILKKRPECWR